MDLKTANTAINVAIETANGLGVKFCIAVMDSGVNLVAFNRMDGGRVGTIDVAMKKVTFVNQIKQKFAFLYCSNLNLVLHMLCTLTLYWVVMVVINSGLGKA